MILRPSGIVLKGELRLGLEVVVEAGAVVEVRPHTGVPDPFVLSPAFVNAHSHLEYRGQQDAVSASSYWEWLRELTQSKADQSFEEVLRWAELAAKENRLTGVALIAEHADRPGVGDALAKAGLLGRIYQEVITVGEQDVEGKLRAIQARAEMNARAFGGETVLNPHAYWTVDVATLRNFRSGPISVHVAESELERLCFVGRRGQMYEALRRWGAPEPEQRASTVELLDQLGLARPGAQFVHCCDLNAGEIDLLKRRGVSVAHCPRSNERLKCPRAPVREMLDAGILVGLGMDSPASGGAIDMFAEVRAALAAACARGKPLSAEEAWSMATSMGAESLGFEGWEIAPGSTAPMIMIGMPNASCTEDLILGGTPESVEWLAGADERP